MAVDLASLILDVPDFLQPGIGFQDVELAFLQPRRRLAEHDVTEVTALVTIEAE